MNKKLLLLVLFVWTSVNPPAPGFSPYELFLLSGEPRRVGLMAFVGKGQVENAKAEVAGISKKSLGQLKRAGVDNLNLFFRELGDRTVLFAFFETSTKGLDGLTTVLGGQSTEIQAMEKRLTPHPRAAPGETWVRMEWINCIATTKIFPHGKREIRKMGLMSGLKPKREVAYRQLHQTTWPGVVDGMVRSNYRNWTTFLIEDGDALMLFTYAEYIGDDIDADNKVMAADPTTQRWWKQTEPCLINLHGEGNWSMMNTP